VINRSFKYNIQSIFIITQYKIILTNSTYGFCSVEYKFEGGSNNSPVCSLQRSASFTIECGLGSFDEFL